MRYLTPSVRIFLLVLLVATGAFRVSLSHLLDAESWTAVGLLAVGYGLALFIAGWVLGVRDDDHLPVMDLGLRFHAATYVVFHAVSYGWMLWGDPAASETLHALHWTAFIWGVLLAVHIALWYGLRRRSIDGLDRDRIFE